AAQRRPSAASSAASPGPGRAGRPVPALAAPLQSGPARRRMALVPSPGLRARVHDPARGRGRARRGGRRPRIRLPLRQPADRPARPRPQPAARPVQLRGHRGGRDPVVAPPGPADGARPGTAVRPGRRRRLAGASFADLHAQLTGLRLAGLAAVAGGALVLWGAQSQRLARNTVLAVGLYLGVSLLGVALYPALIQKLVVAPNELVKEAPQL